MLKFEKLILDSANSGCPSTIPDIQKPSAVPFFICDETVGKDEGACFGKGMVASILPYRMQNCYDRCFEKRGYDAAVLENEYLRAEFLPSLGGRLWSLYDKKNKRDIVYRNDSLIFANLALRNAWFAGGVEWNIGVRGHTYFTCDKMFARKVVGKNGHDILRMYEYEEIRGLVYCIEATLEKDRLLVHITVKNTKDEPTYMYWWSNMAIAETENTRVFVPAEKTFVTSYREGGYRISKVAVPVINGSDISYAKNSKIAIDYFYDIPKTGKKWISGVEADGKGVLQYSDAILQGRKMFLWGKEPGGRHWNKWLTSSESGTSAAQSRDYLEIQAGLCKTQFEHFLIDGGEELSWNEVYTGIDIGTSEGDYSEVCAKIDSLVPGSLDFGDIFTEEKAEPIAYYGCGKGWLAEQLCGRRFHEKCEFPAESVGESEEYYRALLEGRACDGTDKTSFVVGKQWSSLVEGKSEKSFFDLYILGLCSYAEADYAKAYEYLTASVSEKAEYYNLCALGLLTALVNGEAEKGFELVGRAVELNPGYIPLAVKYGELAISCGRYSDFVSFYEASGAELRENGRMKMYVGQCLVQLGKTDEAKKYINQALVVEDVREGEYAISNIWIMLYKKVLASKSAKPESTITDADLLKAYPIPYEIDFRMH